MKYISLKVIDLNDTKDVIVAINHMEYSKSDNKLSIYSLENLNTIYLDIDENNFNKLKNFLIKNDFCQINFIGYVQPFENFEKNVGGKKYKEQDDKIKENANKLNKGKKELIKG